MKQSFKIFLLTISQCFQINSGPKTNIKNDIVQQKKSPNKNEKEIDTLKKEHEKEKDTLKKNYEKKIALLEKQIETADKTIETTKKEKDQVQKKNNQLQKENNQMKRRREESTSPNQRKTFFTPQNNCTQIIVDNINQAQSEILVQQYIFTSQPIIDALIKAHKRGVKITVLLDPTQEYSTQSIQVKNAGISVYIDTIKNGGIAHNKVTVIDKKISLL